MDDEPAGKRPRIGIRGDDDYRRGNIMDIELKNFMTFTYLRTKPGPRLNVVIGPNGAGKSSVVCAIALGLAGEPLLLGRASSIGAFVKRGEESADIKITLRGDTAEELISITRRIDVRNKSEWLLNGKVVPKRDVVDVIRRFNIQINNLTQFLPQDRVSEFAKLSPVQLLEETEKSVGNPELPVHHHALVDKSHELKRLEVTVKANGDTLNQLKALNAEQEKDVERVRQREQLLEKVESMKKKLPWLKYDMKKVEYMQVKEQEKNAKKNLDEAAKILNDLTAPIEKKKQKKSVHESTCKKLSNLIAQNTKKRMEVLEGESRLGVQIRGKYDEMEELKRLEESRQQRISRAKQEFVAAQQELADLPFYEPPKEKLEQLANQILELEGSANQKKIQKVEKESILIQKRGSLRQCVERLKEMESKSTKLLQALRNSGAERIFEAHEWLQSHRHELRKDVYGPVLLEVNVPNRIHAAYLETQVPNYIWKSFITQDSADRDFLVKSLKSFDIPILNYVGDRSSDGEPFVVSEEMRRLGICSRLDQVFDAPIAVKEVLRSQAGLDRSYIGSSEADQKADEVQRLGISDLWTPESHYRWFVSRYGGHVSASVDQVVASRLFLSSSDVGEVERHRSKKKELEEIIANLEESLRTLQAEQRHFEDEAAKLHKQREEIIKVVQLEKRKRRDMETRVNQRKKKVASLENEDDPDTSMKRLADQVGDLTLRRFQLAIEIKSLLVEAVSFKWSFAEKNFASIEIDAKIRELESNLKQHERAAVQASLHFEHCKKETESCRQQLSTAKSHAESIAIITPELAQAFQEMPTTIEELEAAIQDTVSQANSILFLNHNILEEYESRQRKIENIAMKLEADNKELQRCLSEIDTLKANWIPTLINLVSEINETFSRNFQEMAVAGEVSLDEHDTDFDKYGILIKVKFRKAGELQVLSAHHQSGGERSVSTILYLVSLQDLTNCPFRVVDEINQGMDPINERKMFQQLVTASSQPTTPQCFLLTPKLLSGLQYGEACILDMTTGPWISDAAKAWCSGESYRKVMGLE